jgi:hypothetical protein
MDEDLKERAKQFAAAGRAAHEAAPPIVLLEPDQAGSLEALVLALLPAAIRLAQRRAMVDSPAPQQEAA